MNQKSSPRLWTVLGVGIAAIAGLGLLLAFLGRGPGEQVPTITPVTPTPTDDPAVASVNGRPIGYSFWMEAVLLDQVMSGLAGQPAPTAEETLQRLINEELVLQAFPPEAEPTAAQIEARIAALEQTWRVNDDAVGVALENVGLAYETFEHAVGRLLTVQAGLENLQSQGYETTAWLEERRASAEVVIDQDLKDTAAPQFPVAQSPIATPFVSPLPTPAIQSPLASPTPVLATQASTPTPVLAIPEVAPDFTLEQAGGGTLTMSEQLAQGPVVLVFFQRGGG